MAKKKAAARGAAPEASAAAPLVPVERIENGILLVRGERVMLDEDLAELYGVENRALVQAVKRNLDRFPADFMFQLSPEEFQILRSQSVISRWGGRRYPPYVFTEHGVTMLASVLRSERAVQVSIAVVRVFIRLRRLLLSDQGLARQLAQLEKSTDVRFHAVFKAIRMLAAESKETRGLVEVAVAKRRQKPRIGFRPGEA